MKENIDKPLETLVEKVMKQSSLETPSFDFTATVMSRVESSTQSMVTIYKPLISNRAWIFIILGFVAFVIYTVVVNKPEASEWFTGIDFNIMNLEKITSILNGIKAPRIAAYGIGLLLVMLLIQIPLLKNYFDKRISI